MELQIDYEFNHHHDENRDDWTVAGAIAAISKLGKERGGSFCQSSSTTTAISQPAEHYHHNSQNKVSDARLRSNSVTKTSTMIDPSPLLHAPTTSTKRTMCSEQAARLTARFDIDMSNPNQVSTRYDSLSKLMRSLKKKLNQVSELEQQVQEGGEEELTVEQREKLARRPLLEADLAVIQPALEEVEWKTVHLNLVDTNTKKVASSFSAAPPPPQSIEKEKKASVLKKEFFPAKPTNDIKSYNKKPAKDATTPPPPTKCRCNVCNITCPDESSLALHMSGKRHKNQLRRLKEDEEKETAANMMEMKRRQMIKNDLNPASPTATTTTTKRGTKKEEYPKNKKGSVWPKYSLAPPPPPCRKSVPSKQDANHDKKKSISVSSFQKILQEEEEAKIRTKVEKRSLNKCTKNEKRHSLVNPTPPKMPWTPPLNKNNKSSKECQNQRQHEFMDMLPLGWSVKTSSSGTTNPSKAATLLRNTTSSPPAASPCYDTKTSTLTTQSSPTASSFSLSSFLNKQPSPSPHIKKQPPLRKTAPVAPWSNTAQTTTPPPPPPLPNPNSFPSNTTAIDDNNTSFQPTKQQQQQPKPRKISFEQVLKNEQILKEKEGTHGVVLSEAKWYLERRERACSIEKIQEIEIEEQKMRDLIEEQKEIEKMIAKEAQEKKEMEQEKKEKKRRRRRKNRNNKTKDSGGGSGDGGGGGSLQSKKNGPMDNHEAEINKNDSKPKGTNGGGGGRRKGAKNNRKHHSTAKGSSSRNETHANTGGNDEHETNCKSGGRARCQREAPQSIDSSSVVRGKMNTAVATHVV
mmetsp:Transcript_19320/g.28362  ORF Transcript_19320/g.28362 Transcript_19320/m.28362 type:complete len:801 (+) Transcript_19320:1-2403(+)